MRIIEVVPYNPLWPQWFTEASQALQLALKGNIMAAHHIGSTAIPGIHAKPVIDMLLEVANLATLDRQQAQMEALGYLAKGENGIAERRFFLKHNAAGVRTHHIHAFLSGSVQVKRHLAFRDYLRANPQQAQTYSDLKCQLAKQYPTDIEQYLAGKDAFIKAIDHLNGYETVNASSGT